MISGHFVDWNVTYAAPLLGIAALSVFVLLFQKLLGDKLILWGIADEHKKMDVDEDLPNFFKALKLSSAREIIIENANMKENFGFETTDPDTVEGLLYTAMPK